MFCCLLLLPYLVQNTKVLEKNNLSHFIATQFLYLCGHFQCFILNLNIFPHCTVLPYHSFSTVLQKIFLLIANFSRNLDHLLFIIPLLHFPHGVLAQNCFIALSTFPPDRRKNQLYQKFHRDHDIIINSNIRNVVFCKIFL